MAGRWRHWRTRHTGPDDPRARMIVACAVLLWRELEPGDQVLGVGVTIWSAGQIAAFHADTSTGVIRRSVADLSDMPALLRARDALGAVVIDATVPDGPP